MEKLERRDAPEMPRDRAYWLSRPIEERYAAVDALNGRGGARFRSGAGLRNVAELLNSTGVEYMVIGGYALAAHGRPRSTFEIDIWLDSSRGDVYLLLQALNTFGYGSLILSDDPAEREAAGNAALGLPPRIDLMTTIDGVRFDECYARHAAIPMGDVMLPFIDLADLRVNKQASGRAQDLIDLQGLDLPTSM